MPLFCFAENFNLVFWEKGKAPLLEFGVAALDDGVGAGDGDDVRGHNHIQESMLRNCEIRITNTKLF